MKTAMDLDIALLLLSKVMTNLDQNSNEVTVTPDWVKHAKSLLEDHEVNW